MSAPSLSVPLIQNKIYRSSLPAKYPGIKWICFPKAVQASKLGFLSELLNYCLTCPGVGEGAVGTTCVNDDLFDGCVNFDNIPESNLPGFTSSLDSSVFDSSSLTGIGTGTAETGAMAGGGVGAGLGEIAAGVAFGELDTGVGSGVATLVVLMDVVVVVADGFVSKPAAASAALAACTPNTGFVSDGSDDSAGLVLYRK